jgi:arylsulfatase A-like enzyme
MSFTKADASLECIHSVMNALRLFVLAVSFLLATAASAASRPNILLIAVDDLNHWVGHLGRNPQTKTPNIDRLARMGVTFASAHCPAPICNPSRAALLSGKRPNTTGVYDNRDPYQGAISIDESLVTTFKKAGYTTLGAGKLWHGGLGWKEQWDLTGGGGGDRGRVAENRSIGPIRFGVLAGGDEGVNDFGIANFGIEQLGKKHEKPFFLVIGFHKPHMPWNVPKKYYDMHPLDKIELPPHLTNDLNDLPTSGVAMAHALGDHAKVLKSGRWKEAVQAYLAAVSYLDTQLGRVLDALERSPEATNTVVCFFGDHGWHLGEKEHWRKFALWEESTRAPFIWVAPGVTKGGGRCERAVDFMSIYPTLCELAGIPVPKQVQGTSIRKLLADPRADWNTPALTTHGFQNHAVRSDRWRYIRYRDGGEELYDHSNDPYEWTNLSSRAEFKTVKADLGKYLPTLNKADTNPRKVGVEGAEPQ